MLKKKKKLKLKGTAYIWFTDNGRSQETPSSWHYRWAACKGKLIALFAGRSSTCDIELCFLM